MLFFVNSLRSPLFTVHKMLQDLCEVGLVAKPAWIDPYRSLTGSQYRVASWQWHSQRIKINVRVAFEHSNAKILRNASKVSLILTIRSKDQRTSGRL
jgi:hypothetical protein